VNIVRKSLLAAVALVASTGTAMAGGFHVHFGGGAHFGGGFGGGVHVYSGPRVGGGFHWSSGGWRGPRVHYGWGNPGVVVRGGIWVGGGYYDPYYYPTYYTYSTPACECGPSAYYPPVYPAPSTQAYIAPEPPPMPSFGVGLYGGGTSTNTSADGSDVGLFANLRITRGLLVQGALGKTSIDQGQRVDKRYEGALIWEIGAENDWAPYLLAGLGVETADTTQTTSATQNFGEVGAGIRWALTRNIHLTADLRAGSRQTVDGGQMTTAPVKTLSTVAVPPAADSGQSEDFTRFTLGAMLYF
jgi:hypothetical protein